jgi:hypothetical protein
LKSYIVFSVDDTCAIKTIFIMTTHFILETVGHENWKYLIKRDFKLQDRIGSQKTRKNKKLQPTCGVILSQ